MSKNIINAIQNYLRVLRNNRNKLLMSSPYNYSNRRGNTPLPNVPRVNTSKLNKQIANMEKQLKSLLPSRSGTGGNIGGYEPVKKTNVKPQKSRNNGFVRHRLA